MTDGFAAIIFVGAVFKRICGIRLSSSLERDCAGGKAGKFDIEVVGCINDNRRDGTHTVCGTAVNALTTVDLSTLDVLRPDITNAELSLDVLETRCDESFSVGTRKAFGTSNFSLK